MRALVSGVVLLAANTALAGGLFSPPINVSNTPATAFSTGSQQLVVDNAGNGVVVWEEALDLSNANVRDVFFSFSPASSISFSTPFNLSNAPVDAAGGVAGPRAAIDRNLNIYVVWSTGAFGGSRKIALAISTDNGKTFTKKSVTPDGAFDPDVATGPNGEVYVVWGHDTNGDGVSDDVELIASTDGGATFSAPTNVSNTAGPAFGPSVRVDGGGSVYVCWVDRTANASGILFNRSAAGGQAFGTAVTVPKSTAKSRRQRMAVDPAGGVSIIWSENNNEILFSHSSDQGQTFSTELPLQGVKGGQVFEPDVVSDRAGKVHTTFASGTIDNRLIAYAPFKGAGSYTVTDFVTSNNGFHGGPSIAVDGASNVDVTWFENNGATRDVMISHPPIPR